jgi:hypothetical protein
MEESRTAGALKPVLAQSREGCDEFRPKAHCGKGHRWSEFLLLLNKMLNKALPPSGNCLVWGLNAAARF